MENILFYFATLSSQCSFCFPQFCGIINLNGCHPIT
uniref:Uncharacterized protein n=1 Tax=Anguilla anguilla TaxID=7936 RepID=A0A0E9UP82_ANGAN